VGRAVQVDGRAEAAVSLSMPTIRFSSERLPQLVAALAITATDIERDMALGLRGGH
jgi:DNA-binding IclR family transcriptional regulator